MLVNYPKTTKHALRGVKMDYIFGKLRVQMLGDSIVHLMLKGCDKVAKVLTVTANKAVQDKLVIQVVLK